MRLTSSRVDVPEQYINEIDIQLLQLDNASLCFLIHPILS